MSADDREYHARGHPAPMMDLLVGETLDADKIAADYAAGLIFVRLILARYPSELTMRSSRSVEIPCRLRLRMAVTRVREVPAVCAIWA